MSVTVGTSVSVSMAVVGISLFLLVLNDIIRRCKSHLLCALHTLAACDLRDLDCYELLCGVASEFDFIGSKFGLTTFTVGGVVKIEDRQWLSISSPCKVVTARFREAARSNTVRYIKWVGYAEAVVWISEDESSLITHLQYLHSSSIVSFGPHTTPSMIHGHSCGLQSSSSTSVSFLQSPDCFTLFLYLFPSPHVTEHRVHSSHSLGPHTTP